MRIGTACFAAAFAQLIVGCKGGALGTTPSLDAARPLTFEVHSQLKRSTRERVVYSFKDRKDAAFPTYGSLVADKTHALYGTTQNGGFACGNTGYGCGTVFKLTPAKGYYTESVLYRFKGGSDGSSPQAGVMVDATTGALYGTTALGGFGGSGCGFGCGTVFKLTPSGGGYKERVLYAFKSASDGAFPNSNLVTDKTGALYGTNYAGGYGRGTLFKLTPSGKGYTESTVHYFRGFPNDGDTPRSGLIAAKTGALYGTTATGGRHCSPFGCGTVFELKPSQSGYAYRVVYSFKGPPDDASGPAGVLLAGRAGALFGTTINGGSADWGAVFKLTPAGNRYTERLLHSFGTQGDDGQQPFGGVVADAAGALYGTTSQGSGSAILGTVFKLKPSRNGYVASLLHTFQGGKTDGSQPYAGLILESGTLYGMTYQGGEKRRGTVNGYGTVFKVAP